MVATEFIELKEAQTRASNSDPWVDTDEKHYTIPSNATNLILHFHTTANVTFEFVTSHNGQDWHIIDEEHTHDSNSIVSLSNDTEHVMQYVGWRITTGAASSLSNVKLYFGRSK